MNITLFMTFSCNEKKKKSSLQKAQTFFCCEGKSDFSFSDLNVFQLQKSIASEVNNTEVLRLNLEVNRQPILEKCQSYIDIIGGTLT